MKKQLFILMLLSVFCTTGIYAKFPYAGQTKANESILNSHSSSTDTIAIPWLEDFEMIQRATEYPPGITYSKISGFMRLPINTETAPDTNFNQQSRSGNNYIYFQNCGSNCDSTLDEWLYMPGMFLRAGVTYQFSFWYISCKQNGKYYWKTLETKVGLSPTVQGMTMRVGDSLSRLELVNREYEQYKGTFTPNKDAVYYFGIHVVGLRDYSNDFASLSIDDLEVTFPNASSSCTETQLNARNITHNSIDYYRVQTPFNAKEFILKYKLKSTDSWIFEKMPTNSMNQIVTGLLTDTMYYAYLGTICTGKVDTLWSNMDSVRTLKVPVVPPVILPQGPQPCPFPIVEKFDGKSDITWYKSQDSAGTAWTNVNKWYIDTLTRGSAYISGNKGATNAYVNKQSSVYLHTDNFLIPKAKEYLLSFDWKAYGAWNTFNILHYLAVYLPDSAVVIPKKPGAKPNDIEFNRLFDNYFAKDSMWNTTFVILDSTLSEKAKKLVFYWYNSTTTVGPFSAEIDNILFKAYCGATNNLRVKNYPNENSVTLEVDTRDGASYFNIAYKENGKNWAIQNGSIAQVNKKDSLVLSGLNPHTLYDIKVQKICASGDSSLWTETITTKTTNTVINQFPVEENFEDFNAQRCVIVNENQTNKWEVGTAAFHGTQGKGLYVSSNNGVNNQYNTEKTSVSHFYYDLNIPETEVFNISFDWKCAGSAADLLRVSFVDLDEVPIAGKVLLSDNDLISREFTNQRTWKHEEIPLTSGVSGKKKRLIFTWRNSGVVGGEQPCIAIDNIRLYAPACAAPDPLFLIGSTTTTLSFMTGKLQPEQSIVIDYRKYEIEDNWNCVLISQSAMQETEKFSIDQLSKNTTYEIRVRKLCGTNDTSLYSPSLIARTTQPLATLPLYEYFETENFYEWKAVNGSKNQWVVDTSATHGAGKSLYISDMKGNNRNGYVYDKTKPSLVHFYRDIMFSNAAEYKLAFDWKGGNDKGTLSVQIININQAPTVGTPIVSQNLFPATHFQGADNWRRDSIIVKADQMANSVKTLVFTWENMEGGEGEIPIAIDNITLLPMLCTSPKDLKVVQFFNFDSVQIQFFSKENMNNFEVRYTNVDKEETRSVFRNVVNPVIDSLKPASVYKLSVRAICDEGEPSFWSKTITFRTTQEMAKLPFDENFETLDNSKQWEFVNGNETSKNNKWFLGSASYHPLVGNKAVYIDSLNETTNGVSSVATVVHFYRDINFEPTDSIYTLSFNYKGKGVSTPNCYINVAITDLTFMPVSGVAVTTANAVYYSPNIYENDEEWHKRTLYIPIKNLSGTKRRLIFSWFSNESSLTVSPYYIPQPPATIDNILLTRPACNTPKNVVAKVLATDSVMVNWTCDSDPSNNFLITCVNTKNRNDSTAFKTTQQQKLLTNLKANTLYEIAITNECGGMYLIPVGTKALTKQMAIKQDFAENFSTQDAVDGWTFVNGEAGNKWYAGNFNSPNEKKAPYTAAYISNDGGVSNAYGYGATTVHMYRDLQISEAQELLISFDWRSVGNNVNKSNFMKVFLVEDSIYPILGAFPDNIYNIRSEKDSFAQNPYWNRESFKVQNLNGTKKRLVFSWRDDNTYLQPPAAFSNLEVKTIDCDLPAHVQVASYPDEQKAIITWDSVSTSYLRRYKKISAIKWDSITVSNRNYDTLKGLETNNVWYEVQVKNNNIPCRTDWTPSFEFRTLQTPAEMLSGTPFFENFSEESNRKAWTVVENAIFPDNWYLDTAVHVEDGNEYGAYVSNNNGISNRYTNNLFSNVIHIYRDIDIVKNEEKEAILSFDWKCFGNNEDMMNVYLIDAETNPVGGVVLPDSLRIIKKSFFENKHAWKNESAIIDTSKIKNGKNRLVFSWIKSKKFDNDVYSRYPTQPAAAFDNISFELYRCNAPVQVSGKSNTTHSATISWTPQNAEDINGNLRYRKAGKANPWLENNSFNGQTYTLSNLDPSTKYEVAVQSVCQGSTTSAWRLCTVETAQIPDTVPMFEDFETASRRSAWTMKNDNQVNIWSIDTIASRQKNYTAYTSDSNGHTYRYTQSGSQSGYYSYLYRDVVFPVSEAGHILFFEWIGEGGPYGYVRVYLISSDTTLEAGVRNSVVLSGNGIAGDIMQSPLVKREKIELKNTYDGKKMRLVFMWYNVGNYGISPVNPPISIDNISIEAKKCKDPYNMALLGYPDDESVKIGWLPEGSNFKVNYRMIDDTIWQTTTADTNSITLNGLTPNSRVYIVVENNCGETGGKSAELVIQTKDTPMFVDEIETFDTEVGKAWRIVNVPITGTIMNKWYLNDFVNGKERGNSMYLSSASGGTHNNYSFGTTARNKPVHFYRDILFSDAEYFELSFDWKCGGNATDYFYVTLVDTTITPVAGTAVSGFRIGGNYYGSPSWTVASTALPKDSVFAGRKKRLVFSWVNSGSTSGNPGAAVENILMKSYPCAGTAAIQTVLLNGDKIRLTWDSVKSSTNYTVRYKPTSSATWKEVTGQAQREVILDSLQVLTQYNVAVIANCTAGGVGPTTNGLFSTEEKTPFFTDFDATPSFGWTTKSYITLKTSGDTVYPNNGGGGNWRGNYDATFAGVKLTDGGSKSARISTMNSYADWLISPKIFIESGKKIQLEFKLALSLYTQNYGEITPDQSKPDDKFCVLIAPDASTWSYNNVLALWDNKGIGRSFNSINHTRNGDRIKIQLNPNHTGFVRFAFYLETGSVYAGYNRLDVDSMFVRPYVCEDVANIEVPAIDFDVATVKWKPSDNEQYRWDVRYGTGSTPESMQAIDALQITQLKLKELDTNQIYNIFIRSVCSENEVSNWKQETFTTLSLCEKVLETNINIATTDTNATITWAQGAHKSWLLRWGQVGTTLNQMQNVYLTEPSYTISGLPELTDYVFELKAVCFGNDTSNWTNMKTFKTNKTPCPTVSNVAVSEIKTNSATVSWNATPEQVQWEVRYGTAGSNINALTPAIVQGTSFFITPLQAGSSYDVMVRNICGAGDSSDWSNRVSFTTNACPKAENLRVERNTGSDTAKLSWDKNSEHTSWNVAIALKDAEFSTADVTGTNVNPYTVQYNVWGLERDSSYQVAVKALCGTSPSLEWSNIVIFGDKVESIGSIDKSLIELILAPNPAKEYAKLSIIGAEGKVRVSIYSVTGELIMTENMNCTPEIIKEFTIKGLQRGAYTVHIVHEKWTKTEKLIVQ